MIFYASIVIVCSMLIDGKAAGQLHGILISNSPVNLFDPDNEPHMYFKQVVQQCES